PTKLSGVSGSGKTVILAHRTRDLSLRIPEGRILVATLSFPLAEMIGRLLSKLIPPEHRDRIDVLPVYEVCRRVALAGGHAPDQNRLVDPQSTEHVEVQSWPDFFTSLKTAEAHSELMSRVALLLLSDDDRGLA